MTRISTTQQRVDVKKFNDNYDRIFGKKELPGRDEDEENTDSTNDTTDSSDTESGTSG